MTGNTGNTGNSLNSFCNICMAYTKTCKHKEKDMRIDIKRMALVLTDDITELKPIKKKETTHKINKRKRGW